jgi:sulfhydrogenase subunit gamma (sulfur reductase)
MLNSYLLRQVKVLKVVVENSTTRTLYLKFKDQEKFQFLAGQFMQIGLSGFGECPISISSNPKDAKKHFTLTIRAVGELTRKLVSLKRGETAFVRGPFGNGFPEVTKNLVLIGGGCGFIPLISVYEENKRRKDIKIQTFFSGKNKDSIVFGVECKKMKEIWDFNGILEEGIWPGFSTKQGLVTDLLKNKKVLSDALVFVCGPAGMYKPAVKELLKQKIAPANIYLSLEKKMYCGVGVCQHCAVGTKYVCKDGPVFSYEYLRTVAEYNFD